MTDLQRGRLLVAGQFIILGAMLFSRGPAAGAAVGLWSNIGDLMFVGGGVIVLVAFRALGPALTANPVPLAAGKLVTSGVYNRVRHPIYSGLLLMTLGMAVKSGYWVRGVEWVLLLALLLYKVRFEEQLLVARYSGYADYMKRVPALLPRP